MKTMTTNGDAVREELKEDLPFRIMKHNPEEYFAGDIRVPVRFDSDNKQARVRFHVSYNYSRY